MSLALFCAKDFLWGDIRIRNMAQLQYFKSEQIADGSYRIENSFSDKLPFGVYCYLITGEKYALLIDTMFGFGDLKAYCETLTDKPIRLVNTHAHGDHFGGNYHFDSCYMHYRDIRYFMEVPEIKKEQIADELRKFLGEEYKDQIDADDGNFADTHNMKIYPIGDGDVFDLGDRKIEVFEVGGHTPGSVILIDSKTRIAYSGDACNGNTLLDFNTCLPVSVYLQNLIRLKGIQNRFDMMYGGHEIFDPTIIDEGIETAERVIEGTDDKYIAKGIMGTDTVYAAAKIDGAYERADGKRFNMTYMPDKINGTDNHRQIITAESDVPVDC